MVEHKTSGPPVSPVRLVVLDLLRSCAIEREVHPQVNADVGALQGGEDRVRQRTGRGHQVGMPDPGVKLNQTFIIQEKKVK